MSKLSPSFQEDLRMSVGSVILLQALIAAIYIVPVESSPILNTRLELRAVEPVLFLMPIVTLLLMRWDRVSRWFSVLAPAVVIVWISMSLAIPGVLALLAISTGLAAGLFGLRGAFITAVASAVALLVLHALGQIPDLWQLGIALVAVITTLVLMVSIISPVQQVAEWAWAYYHNAIEEVEENRARRSELDQAVEDLAHANRQLALLYERQTALQRIAEEAERTKSSFVAKVSHEFRTPLNMIIGLAGVMIENPKMYGRSLPAAMLEDLGIIQRNCEHLAGLVNDVLALSQAQAGQLVLHRETLQLGDIITEALSVVRPLIDKKKLHLSLELPPHLEPVSCDRTRIRQVILNLLSNAARFTDQGGISITVEGQEHNFLVRVRDTGPGISDEDIERIFEPFCQGTGQVWRDKGGSGLGLTISKQFVELHGGKIWLESNLGEGTTFFVTLPKSTPLTPAGGPDRWISREWDWVERGPRSVPAVQQPARPRVVLYDRFQDLGALLSETVSSAELEVTGGWEDTVASVQSTPAHVVLLRDQSTPDLLTLFQEARTRLPDTPLVGCVVPQQVPAALEAGADHYLIKPVHPSMLHKTLRSLRRTFRHVLIADDDPDTRRLLERMLGLYDPDLEVDFAASGEEVLHRLQDAQIRRECPVDLLLLDLIMPELDGMQVLEKIRASAAYSDMPVIVISAQDPTDFQPVCQEVLVSMGDGIRPQKLMQCALSVSEVLFNPET